MCWWAESSPHTTQFSIQKKRTQSTGHSAAQFLAIPCRDDPACLLSYLLVLVENLVSQPRQAMLSLLHRPLHRLLDRLQLLRGLQGDGCLTTWTRCDMECSCMWLAQAPAHIVQLPGGLQATRYLSTWAGDGTDSSCRVACRCPVIGAPGQGVAQSQAAVWPAGAQSLEHLGRR